MLKIGGTGKIFPAEAFMEVGKRLKNPNHPTSGIADRVFDKLEYCDYEFDFLRNRYPFSYYVNNFSKQTNKQ